MSFSRDHASVAPLDLPMTTLSPQSPPPSGARTQRGARAIEVPTRDAPAIGAVRVLWQASVDPASAGISNSLPSGTRIVALKVDLTNRLSVCWIDSCAREHPVCGVWEGLSAEWGFDRERRFTHIDVGDWLRVTIDADRRLLYAGGELLRRLGILGGRLGVPEAVETGAGAG